MLAGLSAGAMCWFEGGVTRSSGPPETIAGLGPAPGLAERPRRRRARAAARSASTRAQRRAAGRLGRRRRRRPAVRGRAAGAGRLLAPGRGGAARRRGRRASSCAARIEPELLGAGPAGMPLPGDDVEELRALRRLRGPASIPRTGRVRARSHRKGAQASMIKTVAVGTDGSDTAAKAVEFALDLASRYEAKIVFLSAYRPVSEDRLKRESRDAPEDVQWQINPAEDVEPALRDAEDDARERGPGDRQRGQGGRRLQGARRARRQAQGRPARDRQQGHVSARCSAACRTPSATRPTARC